MRLLVVEDNPRTAKYLLKGLRESGFIVDAAHTGVDGLHLALTGEYDAVILDVNLPQMSGWTVLETLRKERATPVLMLTAQGEVDNRVRGLELGADDYLAKPFAFAELVARVRSLLRRTGIPANALLLTEADLTLDVVRRRAVRAGRRIELTAQEFNLLSLLMRRKGEPLARTFIAEQVWDMAFDSGTNVVDVAVRRLRAKVDESFAPRLIHTVRGVGYVLEVRDEDEQK
ncbi:MAG: heavy metal response regulator transcription factor [Anaerolineae bacterium]|jgi:two-component system copper resistance phosphate regulon response regulator CusR|nr:heavy metal response regulator transcription factor [Anaerolineae bacterium]